MKTSIFLLVFFVLEVVTAQTDTIFRMDGDVLAVNILEVNETSVKFLYPEEKATHSISKNSISKVHFSSGRKQEFAVSHNLYRIKGCRDWEKVQISRMESEIHGLYKIDMIGAKAKGATTLSSLAKLQDRAYNKVKIETAMLGGNMAYILEQNTEEAIFGGENGPSKTPGVTLSGLAYTSRKVRSAEIVDGEFKITAIYVLQANEMDLQQRRVNEESVHIHKEKMKNENGFLKLNLHIKQIKNLSEYTIIYSDENEVVLSGVYSSRQGKKKYFNVYLIKSFQNPEQ